MADDKDIGGYLRGMDSQTWATMVENDLLEQDNQQWRRAYQGLVERYNALHEAAVALSEGYCAKMASLDAVREVLPEFLSEEQMQRVRERHKTVAAQRKEEFREKFPLLKDHR